MGHDLLLLLAHLVVEGVGQGCDLLVRIVGFTSSDIDHQLAFVTNDNETFRVCHDFLNIETVTWIVVQRPLDFTARLAEDDLALVRADEDPAVGQPAMGSVILRDMTVLFLSDLSNLGLKSRLILLDEVLVCLVASYKNDILVDVAEGDLSTEWVPSWMAHGLLGHTSTPLTLNLPNVDGLLGLRTQGRQKLVVLGAEGHGGEGFVRFNLI